MKYAESLNPEVWDKPTVVTRNQSIVFTNTKPHGFGTNHPHAKHRSAAIEPLRSAVIAAKKPAISPKPLSWSRLFIATSYNYSVPFTNALSPCCSDSFCYLNLSPVPKSIPHFNLTGSPAWRASFWNLATVQQVYENWRFRLGSNQGHPN